MTGFRLNRFWAIIAKPPALEVLAACNWLTAALACNRRDGLTAPLLSHAKGPNKGVFAMLHYQRSKPEGRHHRTKIRVLLLPRLGVGDVLPTSTWLGHWLGIHVSEAGRHLRRVLAEDGIATETTGRGKAQRVTITAIPERRMAA